MKEQIEDSPNETQLKCDCCESSNYSVDEFYTQANTEPYGTSTKGFFKY